MLKSYVLAYEQINGGKNIGVRRFANYIIGGAPEPIEKPKCSICQDPIDNPNDGCYACPNDHLFHCQCINTWFNGNINGDTSHNKLCPLCRQPICANVAERHEPEMDCAPQLSSSSSSESSFSIGMQLFAENFLYGESDSDSS